MPSTCDVDLTSAIGIDALLTDDEHPDHGVKWDTYPLSFSFPQRPSWWNSDDYSHDVDPNENQNGEPWEPDFRGLNAAERTQFRSALRAWQDVANLNFVEVADTEDGYGYIRVAYSGALDRNIKSDEDPATGWAYGPDSSDRGGDIWLNPLANTFANGIVYGERSFWAVLHEVGHALGLEHSFEGKTLPGDMDSTQYTVMSYTQHNGSSDGFALTPMLYDILAIQHLYGANYSHNSGDTKYLFGESGLQTIWDGGGNDTFSAVNQKNGVEIDLRAGSFSSIGSGLNSFSAGLKAGSASLARDNIAIAFGVTIENAEGSNHDDLIYGNDSNNRLWGYSGADTIWGGKGSDTLIGGGGNDFLRGERGNDKLEGGAEADTLHGGWGNDTLDGGLGADFINGDIGNDYATGGSGNDTLSGNNGNDTLQGGADNDNISGDSDDDELHGDTGDDTLKGGDGKDTLYGGGNDDELNGGDDNDRLFGGSGEDTLLGADGRDTLDGGADNDELQGGANNDTLLGVWGNDTLNGGSGADNMNGGTGDDLYYADTPYDIAAEVGGSGYDTVYYTGGGTFTIGTGIEKLVIFSSLSVNGIGNDSDNLIIGSYSDNDLFGRDGNDTLNGEGGKDLLYGEGGDDQVIGGQGEDTLYGDGGNPSDLIGIVGGNDELYGGTSNDVLHGQGGDDRLFGEDGDDTIAGGFGDDRLNGGNGNDVYFGDYGEDILIGGPGIDELWGGANADTFSVSAPRSFEQGAGINPVNGVGWEIIKDFEKGIDTIEIWGFDQRLDSFDDLSIVTIYPPVPAIYNLSAANDSGDTRGSGSEETGRTGNPDIGLPGGRDDTTVEYGTNGYEDFGVNLDPGTYIFLSNSISGAGIIFLDGYTGGLDENDVIVTSPYTVPIIGPGDIPPLQTPIENFAGSPSDTVYLNPDWLV